MPAVAGQTPAGVTFHARLEATLFGRTFPAVEAVKALGYFQGDTARLPAEDRHILTEAAADWDYTLASVPRRATTLAC